LNTTYRVEHSGPGLGQTQKVTVNSINGTPLITISLTTIQIQTNNNFHTKRLRTVTNLKDYINMDFTLEGSLNAGS